MASTAEHRLAVVDAAPEGRHNRLTRRQRRGALGALAVLAVSALSLWLRARAPMLLWSDTIFDDQLFGRLAGSLAEGKWLGGFDILTLAKGPAYPLFIYGSYRIHVPLLMAEQILYLAASGTLAIALSRLAHSRWLGVAVYVALALNPTHLGATASRPTRELLYSTLSLLLVGTLILIITLIPVMSRRRRAWNFIFVPTLGIALGAIAAAYYLCREERAWIAPSLIVAGAAALIWVWHEVPPSARVRNALTLIAILTIAVLSFGVGLDQVAKRNATAYGSSLVNDLTDGEIARAYTLWQSVEEGTKRHFVPVNRAQREAVYAVSPAAAEMQPALEGAATHWFSFSCGNGAICDDYTGAFFVWALRESASAAGHFTSEAAVQQYFGRIADDIEAACRDGRLSCGSRGFPLVPPLSRSDAGRILQSSAGTASYVFSFAAASPERPTPSGGGEENWRLMTRAIRGAQDQAAFVETESRAMEHQQPVSMLQRAYQAIIWVGAPFALLGVSICLFRARNRIASIAGIAMIGAVLSRILVISVIDAMSYPAARAASYAMPAMDFLVVSVVLGSWLFGTIVLSWVRGRRETRVDRLEQVQPSSTLL